MEIILDLQAYNGSAGNQACHWVGSFLESDAPDVGNAIRKIEFIVDFHSSEVAAPTLEQLYESYHLRLKELPKAAFDRKKQKFLIEFESNIGSAEEISDIELTFPNGIVPVISHKSARPQAKHFNTFFHELRKATSLISSELQPEDDFDELKLMSWFEFKTKQLPENDEDLASLIKSLSDQEERARHSKTDWELLAIEWDEFHKEAKNLLDDPFFWDCLNDYSPHGNDSGHDVLAAFKEWRKLHPNESSETFFNELMSGWGLTQEILKNKNSLLELTTSALASVNAEVDSTDDQLIYMASKAISSMYDEATIALAFAHIKVDGTSPEWITNLALQTIESQLQGDLSDYKTESFNKLKGKLLQLRK